MIGWHYTSLENYQRIRNEGLSLYPLREEIARYGYTKGIWLYLHRQEDLSHLACVAWQVVHKQTRNVVLLRVLYSEDDRWTPDGKHTFSINHRLYHEHPTLINFHEQEEATLIFKPVPPERITLICTTYIDDRDRLINELRKAA